MLSLMLLSFASASIEITYPDPIPSTISLNPFNPSQIIEFTNTNISEDLQLTFAISSNLQDIVTLSKTSLDVGVSPYKGSITLSIPEEGYEDGGSFNGFLTYTTSLGTDSIPVSVVIGPEESEEVESDLIVFPTSKVVTIKQGSEKTQNILISVPLNYPRTVTIQSVDFDQEKETILFGDLNLGQVAPGNSIQIPIVFSGIDAQTGSYQTGLIIFATDSEGQVALPKVSLTLQVTAGISPITGDTFSTPPTCSLSATTMNLNNTYSFTCSGVVSNLQITIPSSNFYVGKNVEVSSGIYRYDFIPIEYGETEFKAEFRYNGASIFQPFKQNIRISSAGSLIPGTSLKFIFTPKLDQATGDEEKYLIQLADNKTGSLVSSPRIWVNAIELNSSSSDTFQYAFEPNKDYEVRGKSPGYEDFVQTININPQKIEIRINPGVGDSSTMFNITTSVNNATLTILDQQYIGSYYGVLPGGIVELKAVKDGYKTEIINFTVDDRPKILAFGTEFKKNVAQNFTLNKIGDWIVYHKKSMDATERTEFVKGTGDLVEFTPDKAGSYVIEVEGIHVGTFEIEGFSFTNKWGFLPAWAWLIFGGILAIIILVVVLRKRAQGAYDTGQQDGAGLSVFNVGDQ